MTTDGRSLLDVTDRDLPPLNRVEANYWKMKYFELLHTIRGAHKGIHRLQKRLAKKENGK